MITKIVNKSLFIVLLSVSFYSNNVAFYDQGKTYIPERPTVRLRDLVGSKPKEVDELIQQIKNPEKFERLGIDPPNAVLLHGQPGTGKTTLARAIASELDTYIFAVSGSDLKSTLHGGIANNINSLFTSARDLVQAYEKPIVILLDELDGILGGIKSNLNDSSAKEFLSKMKFEITNTESNKGIYVFATTNHISCFPKALTRSGRFMTIEVSLPNLEDRTLIFKKYVSEYAVDRNLKTERFCKEVAKKTALFSGADLKETMQKAALNAAYSNQKIIREINVCQAIKDIHERKNIELRKDKFAPEKSYVKLNELAGSHTKEIRLLLKQLKEPEKFSRLGASAPKAVLLYGPPGTGKTTLVRGTANHLDANLFTLSGPDIESGIIGGAAKNLGRLFHNARKMAKCSGKPSVILFDEMDGAISNSTRREILAKLKYELTEKNENVFIFATTNHLHYFPPALTRPGRFVKIEVPLPKGPDRMEIFKKYANLYKTEKKVRTKNFCIEVAKATKGFSCADIANILERAAQNAAYNNQDIILCKDVLEAIKEKMAKKEETE